MCNIMMQADTREAPLLFFFLIVLYTMQYRDNYYHKLTYHIFIIMCFSLLLCYCISYIFVKYIYFYVFNIYFLL